MEIPINNVTEISVEKYVDGVLNPLFFEAMIKAVMSLTNGLPKPIKLKVCFDCNIEPTMMRSKSKYYCDCNCLSSDFKAITRESEEDAIIAWNVKQDIAVTEEAVAKGELK